MSKIGVLGAGTWGMALSRVLANAGHEVTLWSALPEELDTLQSTKQHKNLPGMTIPESLLYERDIEKAVRGKDFLLFAVPSVYVRSTAKAAAPYIEDQILIDVAKGIETPSLLFLSEVIREETGDHPIVAFSGPSHAEEVAFDTPTTIVSASADQEAAKAVQELFRDTCIRVYTNEDIKGVELCGAVKNVIAIASGIAKGLGYGDNTRAALITRGMAEITRLGIALGGRQETFAGLAGIGDLIVTATSDHSRNNRFGFFVGQGLSVEEAKQKVGMVVEGLNAIRPTLSLAQKYGVEMPISEKIYQVLFEGKDAGEAVEELMGRHFKKEY